jgi:transposase
VILWSESHPEAPGRVRRRVKKSAERAMRRHLNQPWQDEDAVRIAKELKLRRRMLFTYVVEPGVPWHNNAAENQIRQGVLFRKISGGRRSWPGAAVLERLLTVYRTCRKRQFNFLDVVMDATTGKGYPKFATSGKPET